MYASGYSLAIYVQLFALSTPFIVALLTRIFLKEPIPKAFFLCVTVSILGSLLLLVDDFANFAFVSMGPEEIFGLCMCLVTSFFLALYMITSKVAANHGIPISQGLMVQGLVSAVVALSLSFIVPTDWSVFATYDWRIWLLLGLATFIFGVGNGINMYVINKAGPSFNSFFIGIRLLVSILGSLLFLGEKLDHFWQWIGVVIILLAATAFLVANERAKAKKRRQETELALKLLPPPERVVNGDGVDLAESSELALLGDLKTAEESLPLGKDGQKPPEYEKVGDLRESDSDSAGELDGNETTARSGSTDSKPEAKKSKQKGGSGYEKLAEDDD